MSSGAASSCSAASSRSIWTASRERAQRPRCRRHTSVRLPREPPSYGSPVLLAASRIAESGSPSSSAAIAATPAVIAPVPISVPPVRTVAVPSSCSSTVAAEGKPAVSHQAHARPYPRRVPSGGGVGAPAGERLHDHVQAVVHPRVGDLLAARAVGARPEQVAAPQLDGVDARASPRSPRGGARARRPSADRTAHGTSPWGTCSCRRRAPRGRARGCRTGPSPGARRSTRRRRVERVGAGVEVHARAPREDPPAGVDGALHVHARVLARVGALHVLAPLGDDADRPAGRQAGDGGERRRPRCSLPPKPPPSVGTLTTIEAIGRSSSAASPWRTTNGACDVVVTSSSPSGPGSTSVARGSM